MTPERWRQIESPEENDTTRFRFVGPFKKGAGPLISIRLCFVGGPFKKGVTPIKPPFLIMIGPGDYVRTACQTERSK